MPEPLQEAVNAALTALGLDKGARRYRALALWSAAVGENIAAHAKAVGVSGTTLLVHAESPAWAQQLSFLKPQLLAAVNQAVGTGDLTDLRFVGRRLADRTGDRTIDRGWPYPRRHGPGAPRLPELAPEQRETIAQAAATLSDPELARRLTRVATTAMRLASARRSLGWRQCPHCGALRPPADSPCPVCRRGREEPAKELDG